MSLSTHTEEPVLDLGPFHELFDDGDPEGAAWLESYLETATRALQDMRCALADGDRTKLAISAHRIGGTSLVVGVRRVGLLCQAIELEAPRKPAEELAVMVEEVDQEFDAARDAIIRLVTRD
ncbi:MAG TPA: Hpt domain-containing protein [Stellaceae bacterium]|nr:Hpt domain-containing protein [Stellaceae bacterium]